MLLRCKRRSPLSRYGVAVITSLLAFFLRFLLVPVLGDEAPLLVFFTAVMFSGWYGGVAAGLVATVLSCLLGVYFFVPYPYSWNVDGLHNRVRIGIFVVEGVLISLLNGALRTGKRRAENTASSLQESEERYRLLVQGVRDYAIFMLDSEGRIASWLEGLHDIDRGILEAQSSTQLVRSALVRMRRLVSCKQTLVVLFNFENREAEVLASSVNGDRHTLEDSVIPLNNFLPDEVFSQDPDRYIEYFATERQCPSILASSYASELPRCKRIPLLVEREVIGELILLNDRATEFTQEEQEIATEVATQLAIAIGQTRLREQLQVYTAELEERVARRTVELQEANEVLEAFAYSVSHELRAPLRAIQALGDIFLQDYANQLRGEGLDFIRRITRAAQTMNTLIQDLLDYSRLSRAEIRLQPLSLNMVVTEVLSQLREELQARQALVSVETPLPEVVGNPSILIGAIANLISNAIKFTLPNLRPQIRVWAQERIEEDREWVRLWVEDNGIGIEPRYQERIFQVFERLHGTETYPGTGIGLAIVRKGIERMGGRVGVESELGQGSRFWIELPKAR